MSATILDFVRARRTRQAQNEIRELVNAGLEKIAEILESSDEEIDAMLAELPPEYRAFAETGDTAFLSRMATETGFDESDYEEMAEKMIGLATGT